MGADLLSRENPLNPQAASQVWQRHSTCRPLWITFSSQMITQSPLSPSAARLKVQFMIVLEVVRVLWGDLWTLRFWRKFVFKAQ